MNAALLPFSREQFFELFATYNSTIWPAQFAAYGLAGIALLAIVFRVPHANRIVLGVLAALWAWTGVAYHILSFAAINRAALVFGALFVVQALVFGGFAIRGGMAFSRTSPSWPFALLLILYAMGIYPLAIARAGHTYPAAPSFGVTPCPLVIFTFGLVLLSPTRLPWSVPLIPIIWAIVGGSAAFLLDVYPDLMLPASAILVLVGHAARKQAS